MFKLVMGVDRRKLDLEVFIGKKKFKLPIKGINWAVMRFKREMEEKITLRRG